MVVCGLLTQLKEFHARHAAQTQAGNAQFQALPKLARLKIETVDISAADVEAIQAALPKCKVEWKAMSDAEKEATLAKKLRL